MDDQQYGSSKRPVWQWVLLYAVIAGVLYGVIYFLLTRNGNSYSPPTSSGTEQTQPAPQNNTPAASTSTKTVTPAAPETANITISNSAFNSSHISVKAGTKVTWTNNDAAAHTVTSDTGAFDSGVVADGSIFSFVFKTPGTYNYHCSIHPHMKAAVIVTP